MNQVTQVAKNPERGMSVELVEVQSITWKIASLRNKVGQNDLVGSQRRRSLVRLLPPVASFVLTHSFAS